MLSAVTFHQLIARVLAVFLLWLSVGIPAAHAMGGYTEATLSDAGEVVGDGRVVVLKPETWTGKTFPLLPHIDIGENLKKGKWRVFLYRHACPTCEAVISGYRQFFDQAALKGDTIHMALIELPPYSPEPLRHRFRGTPWSVGRLSNTREWFVTTPREVILDDAIVIRVDDTRN